MTTFLSPDELRTLTGRARAAAQIEALRRMGLPFWVNARGQPVVARSALDGQRWQRPTTWEPRHGTQA